MRASLIAWGLGSLSTAMVAAQAQTLTSTEAGWHIGEMATVCGRVVSPRFVSASRGQPTFLNLDKAEPLTLPSLPLAPRDTYHPAPVSIVIWGSDRPKFGTPEVTYRDKNICVTGKIQAYRGAAEIVLSEPKQIRLQ